MQKIYIRITGSTELIEFDATSLDVVVRDDQGHLQEVMNLNLVDLEPRPQLTVLH
jgi:hypothetical protein